MKIVNVLNQIQFTTIPVQLSEFISAKENIVLENLILKLNFRHVRHCFDTIRSILKSDIVHTHHTSSSVLISFLFVLSKVLKKKPYFIHTVHRNFHSFSKIKQQTYKYLVLPFRDAVIANSKTTFASIPDTIRRRLGGRLSVIYNGVDIREIPTHTPFSNPQTTIINIARMVPIKNQFLILEAISRLKEKGHNVELEFCGDGPLENKLKSYVDESNLASYVRFNGLLPRDEVFRKLRKADIAITASFNEGFGVATIEAMCAHLLVLASDIDVHNEIVNNKDLLFSPTSSEQLAEKISYFMGHKNEALEKVAFTSSYAKHFDIRNTVKAHIELYSQLISLKNTF